jgi:hypothetical protein
LIGIPAAMLIGVMLLLVLLLLAARGMAAARELPSGSDAPFLEDASESTPCPPEFASRIFSPHDSKFVSSTKSPQLAKLFRSERKIVALLWVQQTSAAIQRTMREHAQIARASEDLEFATEMKLALLYAELMLICGVLLVAIRTVGPLWLGRLAVYADAHLQRLARVQESFKASTFARQLHGAGTS